MRVKKPQYLSLRTFRLAEDLNITGTTPREKEREREREKERERDRESERATQREKKDSK